MHICLDPKYLNEAIKREHHPIPTLEQITPKLCGSTLFSKLDAEQGYWNVKLDAASTLMPTFHTPFGRYKFLRRPFGLRMSQDLFQQKIDQTYENCNVPVGIADDVQVFGNEKTHDGNLHEAMECTRKAGIKLNFDKCAIKTKCCIFLVTCTLQRESSRPKESRCNQTDAATNEQTAAQFFPRYGNLFIFIYAKHFFTDIRFERFA